MRALIPRSILLIVFLLNSSVFAYVSGKVAVNEEAIYCPDQIICTESRNLKSCKYSGAEEKYWDFIGDSGDLGMVAGRYKFTNVNAIYHAAMLYPPVCTYENSDNGSITYLALYGKFEINLELFYKKPNNWNVNGHGGSCRSEGSPQACPLHYASSLGVLIKDVKDSSLYASINYLRIFDQPLSEAAIRYEDALSRCSDTQYCKIDFTNESYSIIGSVIVDMDNKMKIVQVIPYKSSGIEIKQSDSFNTIVIKKSESLPIVASMEIYNKINLELTASANQTQIIERPIASRSRGSIFLDRALVGCRNDKQCQIDISTSQGGSIGSVIVDMENNMNILQVSSNRSSEIEINKIGMNTIEIGYAFR